MALKGPAARANERSGSRTLPTFPQIQPGNLGCDALYTNKPNQVLYAGRTFFPKISDSETSSLDVFSCFLQVCSARFHRKNRTEPSVCISESHMLAKSTDAFYPNHGCKPFCLVRTWKSQHFEVEAYFKFFFKGGHHILPVLFVGGT